MNTLNFKLPLQIRPTAKNDGYIITDAKGTEFFFYNQKGTKELEYDGWAAPIDPDKIKPDPSEN